MSNPSPYALDLLKGTADDKQDSDEEHFEHLSLLPANSDVAQKNGTNNNGHGRHDPRSNHPEISPIATLVFALAVISVSSMFIIFLLPRSAVAGQQPSETQDMSTSIEKKIPSLRRQLANISIDLMLADTVEAAASSPIVDIGPLVDLIYPALDEIGVDGVHTSLLPTLPFLAEVERAGRERGLHHFYLSLDDGMLVHYDGVPNDRNKRDSDADGSLCTGCVWWLRHWIGAITAEKLVKEGSLLVDPLGLGEGVSNPEERIEDAPAFMKHMQKLQDQEYADPFVFHTIHGFMWHYVGRALPTLEAYPTDLALDCCGHYLTAKSLPGSSRECWHSFGHAVFYSLALPELYPDNNGGRREINIRHQLRPNGGFQLSEEGMCKGIQICKEAPKEKHQPYTSCKGGLTHSQRLFMEEVTEYYDKKGLEKRCLG